MDYPKEGSKSLFDYSDKSVQHAGYAAIVYGAVNLFGAVLALIQFFIYHKPAAAGRIHDEVILEQSLQQTPLVVAVAVGFAVIIAAVAGVLAFFIFRRSRFAVVAMIVFIVVLQLYTWLVAHSIAGTLVSIVVVAFLLRGARRIFQEHAERQLDAANGA